ncbi:MAG: hypothetical protein AAGN66_22750 [Acidobacteriota bacterium]
MTRSIPRLGAELVRDGLVDEGQLRRALERQRSSGGRLGTQLLEMGAVRESALLDTLSRQRATQGVSAVDLDSIPPSVARLIPAKLAHRWELVPFKLKGRTLYVAAMDPGDPLREDEISFLTSHMVRTCIGLELRLRLALRQLYRIPCDPRFTVLAKALEDGGGRVRGTGRDPGASGPIALPSQRPSPPLPGGVDSTPSMSSPPSQAPPAATASGDPASSPSTAPRPIPAPSTEPPPSGPPSQSQSAGPGGPDVEFVEVDTEDLRLLRQGATVAAAPSGPTVPSVPEGGFEDVGTDPEARLDRASAALQGAEIRDEIGDALLGFCEPYFKRRLLLIARKDHIVGWRGMGEDVDESQVRGVDIDAAMPSIFLGLRDAASFWLGPVPPLPANQQLVGGLGGVRPRDCCVLPVVLRSKVVCYLYGDNLGDTVARAPVAELKRLVAKAGLAFEVYILKNKLRVL